MLVAVVITNNGIAAQDSCHYNLKGQIFDSKKKIPIPYVAVLIYLSGKSQVTDEYGKFDFKGELCPTDTQIKILAFGFQPLSLKVNLSDTSFRNFSLNSYLSKNILEEVVIHSKKKQNLISSNYVVDSISLFKNSGKDLASSLLNIPGVSIQSNGPTINKPTIHGLTGNRILVFNNGVRLEGQQWGSEHAPEVDPYNSRDIQVIKGSNVLKYGSDAIAGVIFINAKPWISQKGIVATFNSAFFSNNFQFTNNVSLQGMDSFYKNEFAFNLNYTNKYGGNSYAPNYYLSNTGLRENDHSISLHHHFKNWETEINYSIFDSKIGIYLGSHIGNLTDLKNAIQKQEPAVKGKFQYEIQRPYQSINHEIFNIKTELKLNSSWKSIYKFSRQFNNRNEFDILRNSVNNANSDNPQSGFRLTTFAQDLILEKDNSNKKINYSFGLSHIRQLNTFRGFQLIPNFVSDQLGVFYIINYQVDRLNLEAGCRYDIKKMDVFQIISNKVQEIPLSFNAPTFSLGALYSLKNNNSLKLNFGRSFRAPHISELYISGLHHGTGTYELGNKDLALEISYKLVSSIIHQDSTNFLELDLWNDYIQNFIYLKPNFPEILTSRGAFPSFKYTGTLANFSGCDFLAERQLHRKWKLNFSTSFIYAWDLSQKQFLINTPPLQGSLGLKYSLNKSKYSSNSYLAIDFSGFAKQGLVKSELDYALPPNGYVLTSVSYFSQLKWNRFNGLFSFQIANIFNQKYRNYLDKFRYFADAQGINIQLKLQIKIHS